MLSNFEIWFWCLLPYQAFLVLYFIGLVFGFIGGLIIERIEEGSGKAMMILAFIPILNLIVAFSIFLLLFSLFCFCVPFILIVICEDLYNKIMRLDE